MGEACGYTFKKAVGSGGRLVFVGHGVGPYDAHFVVFVEREGDGVGL